ncbi:hypothetical protein P154DRAFT_110756 [Amniculicola lignicola CBS 123094]|uniref:Uncharacterized protein n=1 Tax=Amniculicola lignicola CBS 123094 TaxID=1392246 RepID=A0A6A5WPX8_9PLEO|nr:hypothetical protein P154DRAFT_110756 [Amniculicola lignicola CBS 123094]
MKSWHLIIFPLHRSFPRHNRTNNPTSSQSTTITSPSRKKRQTTATAPMSFANTTPLAVLGFVGASLLSVLYISPTTFGTVMATVDSMKANVAVLFGSVVYFTKAACSLLFLFFFGFAYLAIKSLQSASRDNEPEIAARVALVQNTPKDTERKVEDTDDEAGSAQASSVERAFLNSVRKTQDNLDEVPLPPSEPTASPEPHLRVKVVTRPIGVQVPLPTSSPMSSPALGNPTIHPTHFAQRLRSRSRPQNQVHTPVNLRSSVSTHTNMASPAGTGPESPFRKSLKTLKDSAPNSFLSLRKAGLLNEDGTPTEKMEEDAKYRHLLREEVRVVELTTKSGKVILLDD